MQGYPSRQLKGGARGGLQAFRCGAQSRPAALRGCKAPLYDYQNCLVKKIVGAVTQVECKRVRGTAAVTTQTQALADFSLQVRKGSTWPLRVEEDQEGEEGRFWLAKIKDEPERLEGTMTFAGQAFKEGWIVAKAQYLLAAPRARPGDSQGAGLQAAADRHLPLLEPHHQTGVVREHGGGQQIQEQTQAMGAQGCGQGAHRSCAVICNKGSGRSERRRRFLLPLRVCFVCLWALLLRARWWPWGLCGCSGVWFPLLYFNKKRPDLAGSTRGEHATNVARFIRRGLASLW